MTNIKKALWEDYKAVNDLIDDLSIDDEGGAYKIALEERDKIRNELIKLVQIEQEDKTNYKQIQSENKRDKIRNIINVVTFGVSTCVSVYSIIRTFKFDQTATVTSTLGRNILNGVVPKMLKR